MISGGVADLRPRTALVFDFDLDMIAWGDLHSDGEGATWQTGAAVEGSVGGEFGGAKDHFVCHRAVTQ